MNQSIVSWIDGDPINYYRLDDWVNAKYDGSEGERLETFTPAITGCRWSDHIHTRHFNLHLITDDKQVTSSI